ncbi:FHA domain-containing protein, partial [Streptomyces sp. NPDC056948]|uniref:FHA domain-containing protein n=1 Tax=Streptomyces sp. NPDC056948 TaxID=3345975 RepID=UPI00363E176E
MQIRLTVVDPLGPSAPAQGRAPRSDVLVTAPAGTALAAVASALAQVVSGGDGSGTVVLYAGEQRLDAQRCTLGEPPLTDGAVLSVGAPGEPEPHPELDDAPAQLQVVAGPDAGGVHLLHGGEIRIGRSADADVPLDDPDVSRLHCAVTVGADGRVAVADLDSTNGTTLDGRPVGSRVVRFAPGALLRIGESALRLAPAGGPGARVGTTPDGEGHVRVPGPAGGDTAPPTRAANPTPAGPTRHAYGSAAWGTPGTAGQGSVDSAVVPGQGGAPRAESRAAEGPGSAERGRYPGPAQGRSGAVPGARGRRVSGARGDAAAVSPEDSTRGASPDGAIRAPRQRGAAEGSSSPMASPEGPRGASQAGFGAGDTHVGRFGVRDLGGAPADRRADGAGPGRDGRSGDGLGTPAGSPDGSPAEPSGRGRKGTPLRGTDIPQGARRRGGLGAWARRLAGGRGEQEPDARATYEDEPAGATAERSAVVPTAPETWPDPATLLLTALGPGPRLWERGPGHPEALAVRLGTADRTVPDGSGLLPAVPVTAGLREAGALGLAGPRARLGGLARALLAQLTALHSPDMLEIVLIAADRSRPLEERTAEWSWLGWLPHVRPGHGQDCRLLLAHDREQAAARTDELLRRLEDQLAEAGPGSAEPLTSTPLASTGEPSTGHRALDDAPGTEASVPFPGPFTVLVVDGDPGGADLREAVARLAAEGPRAGIHVVCLAETAAASPASPVTETYEAACAVSPTFRQCGAVALLSGDVATALRLMRVARAGAGSAPAGHGTVATVDAVSPAWAERFARALAPLRTDAATSERQPRVSAPLPQAARLLDELGLARATPASLMARWADAADDADALGGRVRAVLGAGPR